jgi:hypothetical protein
MPQPIYYISYSANQWKLQKPIAGTYATYDYTDYNYFNKITSSVPNYIEIADYSFNILAVFPYTNPNFGVRSIDDTFRDVYDVVPIFEEAQAYDPTAQNFNISRLNEWSYIKNIAINNKFIDDIQLQNFNLFIFKSTNDTYYFNIKKNNINTGIELEVNHNFMGHEEVLHFLRGSDINVFLYDKHETRSLSSTIDYALSVKKPIAISNSVMFKHIQSATPSICVDDLTLPEIIANGITPLEPFYEQHSNKKLLEKYEYALTTILNKK